MDKRSLIFFLALSLTLFLVNYGFSRWEQEKNKEWVQQYQAKKAQQLKLLRTEILARTVSPSDLPVVELYSDSSGNQKIGFGVKSDESILASKLDTPPRVIYFRKVGSNESLQEAQQFLEEDSFSVYSTGSSLKLPTAILLDYGNFDLQLVSVPPSNPNQIIVTLGEYRDHQITLPAKKLVQEFAEEFGSSIPQTDAIALAKIDNIFVPVGIYDVGHEALIPFNQFEKLKAYLSYKEKNIPKAVKGDEKFYVLENDYQQLVFSNIGGALAEINLPFQTEQNTKSVVLEVENDQLMAQDHPYNAHFPAHPYFTPGNTPESSPEFHDQTKIGGYYPLLRRDLIESKGVKSIKVKPPYYAFNIVSEYPEVAELVYEVKYFDNQKIVFEAIQNHRKITKTYSLADEQGGHAPYVVHLTIKVEGDGRGLWLTSGIPEVEWLSGSTASALKYRITRQQKPEVETLTLPKDVTTVSSIVPDWICNSNGFFGIIMDALSSVDAGYKAIYVPGNVVPSRLLELDEKFQASELPGYGMMLPLKSSGGTMQFRLFAGPFAEKVLTTVDTTFSDPATGYNPDYIACQSFHGWFAFISEPFAKLLLFLMKFFHQITGSWGLSIILLTVALRILLYPLNSWSMKSMASMQEIAPEISALQEKYKKDPKKLQLEIATLYRERGVNPLSGCFPLLIQMPFLIGMFDLLKSTYELRGASFIPGWIDDLSAPDVVFRWHTPIFFIGNEFHLLPILLGVVMFAQQHFFSTAPKDANLMTDQQRQQRVMGNMMTVVFAFMFYHVPSGLNIYWLSSMLLGILQQWWTMRQLKSKKNTSPKNPIINVKGQKLERS
jgi:YidC/Oxa1 family membrane protein insertase